MRTLAGAAPSTGDTSKSSSPADLTCSVGLAMDADGPRPALSARPAKQPIEAVRHIALTKLSKPKPAAMQDFKRCKLNSAEPADSSPVSNMLHGASSVANARTPIHGAAAEDALLTEPDDGGHAQLASTATASIFKRSALLSNMLSAKALVHCGAIGSNSGCSSAKRPRATAHDFGHLSALALASERAPCKTDAIIVDGHFHSGLLGHTDGAKPCDVASSSSADFIQGLAHAFADDAGISQLVPGWVPGAPPPRGAA